MKRIAVLIGLCLFLLAASEVAAQHPDFSGEWTVRAEERGGFRAGEFGSGWGRTVTMTQDATTLTVEWAFFTRGDLQPPLKFAYPLDGSRATATVLMGRGAQEQVSTAVWQGDRLVITTEFPFENPRTGEMATTTMRRTLSLTAPDTLVVETTIDGVPGGAPTTSRTVYTRS